jgi:hypothetical protein
MEASGGQGSGRVGSQVKYICIKRLKLQVYTQCTEVDSFVISLSWGKQLDLAGAQVHLRAPNSMQSHSSLRIVIQMARNHRDHHMRLMIIYIVDKEKARF